MQYSKAELWRVIKPARFETPLEYLKLVLAIDPLARGQMTDLGVIIKFSDGSLHRMDNDRPRNRAA